MSRMIVTGHNDSKLTVRISKEQHEELKVRANQMKTTLNELVLHRLEQELSWEQERIDDMIKFDQRMKELSSANT